MNISLLSRTPSLVGRSLLPLAATIALVGCATNEAPVTPEVAIGPDGATSEDDLVVELAGEATDEDEDTVSLSFSWSVDGQYRGDLDGNRSVPASLTSKGQEWTVTVNTSDGLAAGMEKSASLTVANAAPVAVLTQVPFAPDSDEDFVVEFDTFDADGDSVVVNWSWTVDGADAGISGPNVPASLTTRGEVWEVTATPTDGEISGEPVTAVIDIANRRPTVQAVTLTPTQAFETTTLNASAIAFDPDEDETVLTWAWFVNGVEIKRGDEQTLTGDDFNRGDAVVVVAVANDGFVDGQPSASDAVEIQNSIPVVATVTIDQTDVVEGTDVTCSYDGFSDADGDEDNARLSWEVDGRPAFEGAALPGAYFDRGQQIVCVATPNDGIEDGRALRSAPVRVLNSLPTITSITLDNLAPAEGDSITATVNGAVDPDGDPITLAYAWSVNGTVVSTDTVLTSASFNKGDTIELSITPNDGLEDGVPALSPTATAVNTAPVVNTVTLAPTSPDTDDVLTATVDAADADSDTLSFTYEWTVGGSVVGGESGATLSGDFFAKSEAVTVSVVANDGDADSASVSAASVTVENTAPAFTGIAITPSAAFEDTVLTCAPSGWSDLDEDAENYDYDWAVNGTSVATTQTLDGSLFSKGDEVVCAATANDLDDTGNTLSSSAVTIDNSLPTLADVSLSDLTPLPGDTLTATAGATTDADGDTVTVEYAWTIDGADAGSGSTLDLTGATKDAVVVVTATPSDDEESGLPVTATATIANQAPVISAVSITPGSAKAGDTLTATVTATDADGDALTYTYEWSVDSTVVVGETGETLSTGFASGQSVTVSAIANDGDDNSASVVSAALVIDNSAPSLDAATLNLTAVREADTLTCVPGTFTDADGDSPVYTYLWSNGATTASIDGSQFDKGDVLSCTITPGDGTDTGTPVTTGSLTVSNTAPVLASASLPTTITAEADVTPTIGSTSDADGDTVTLAYAWTVDSVDAGTGTTLAASAFTKGQVIVLTVTPNDGDDDGAAVATSSVTVGNTAPTLTSVSLSPTSPGTDDAITATAVSDDLDGDSLTTTYAWTVNSTAVSGATTDTLAASNFAKDDVVEVSVTVDDGTDTTSQTASVTVGNTAPTAPTVSISAVDVEDDEDLICSITTASTDADSDSVTYAITWTVDGVAYTGTTGTTTLSGDTIDASETSPTETWACAAVANDGTDDGPEGTATADVTYCTIVITATDSVSVDYDAGTIDASDEVTIGLDTGYDAVGWYQFDLSSIDDTATIRSAVLSAYESGGGALGSPTVEVAVSDDDGWVPSTLTYGNLEVDGTVSDGGVSSITTGDVNEFELDVSAWTYADDLSDDEVSLGLFSDTTGSLAAFAGPDASGEEPTLTMTLESCD